MGIYIKDLELPECCDKCPFKKYIGSDRLVCGITGYRFNVWDVGWGDKPYIRHETCPLIEIPDKHGRLNVIEPYMQHDEDDGFDELIKPSDIDYMHTPSVEEIIEADGE